VTTLYDTDVLVATDRKARADCAGHRVRLDTDVVLIGRPVPADPRLVDQVSEGCARGTHRP
jgi:2,4-dienoyl-CoA reductase-like NADH-dependent reductase (Old Yellow Enzyme family)